VKTRTRGQQLAVPSEVSTLAAVVIGSIGGIYIAKLGAEHLFVHGVTREERRNIMLGSACAAAVMAAKQFFDLDAETIAQKLVDTVGG